MVPLYLFAGEKKRKGSGSSFWGNPFNTAVRKREKRGKRKGGEAGFPTACGRKKKKKRGEEKRITYLRREPKGRKRTYLIEKKKKMKEERERDTPYF